MNKYEPEMDEGEKSKNAETKAVSTPDLPLPSLNETAEQFTAWFTPVLTNEQRAKTRTALNAFLKPDGLGARLHEKLQQSDARKNQDGWLNEYWTDRFLGRRDTIAINDNYFFLFRAAEMKRAKRAAALIAAALNYKLVLDTDQIPMAVERSMPVCAKQMNNLFSTTRIPGERQDRLQQRTSDTNTDAGPARHIVVFCRGNIFQLDIISIEGQPHALRDIERGLEHVIDHTLEEQPAGRSIGHLTTLQRSDWARTRLSLISGSRNNAENLDLIENALFSVHLEDHGPADHQEACDHLLQGNSGNRWFDKSLQFIIFANGHAGLNVEHAALDRATIIDFLDYILGIDPNSIDQYSGATEQGVPFTKELAFDLAPTFQKKITRAAAIYEKLKQNTVTKTLEFTDFNVELLAQKQISPDAFAQCALQLAHWRTKQAFAAVGQNISMRHYTCGRVQSMWVLSSQMIDFVTTMLDLEKTDSKKTDAFMSAARQHETRILESRNGVVPRQHLSELHNIYNRHPEDFESDFLSRFTSGGKGLPPQEISDALELFNSPGWTCMKKDAFTTSFLASPTIIHHGFCPADHDNISIGCQVQNGVLNAYLCADQGHEEMLEHFVTAWQQALAELQTLVGANTPMPDIELDD